MLENIDLFTLLKAGVGVYLIVCAIRGKGKLLDNDYPKGSKERYMRIMRICCLISGILVTADGVFGIFGVLEAGSVAEAVLMWVALATILALAVLNVALTDRKAMEKARQEREAEARNRRNNPLHAAFDFDDEDSDGDAGAEDTRKEE